MDNLKLFGKRIKELRNAKGLKQETLGEIIGLDVKQVSNIETGTCFTTMSTLEKMAECFEVELFELFNFSHLKTKEELIPALTEQLENSTEKEVQLITKIINSVLH